MRLFASLTGVALRSLASHKMRSALTMLGVIIGVGAVIVMLAIGEGAKRKVSKNITSLGTNLLVIRPGFNRRGPVRSGSVQTLTRKDAEAIAKQVDDIAHVSPEAAERGPIAAIADGDTVIVDIPGCRLDVELTDEEIDRRLANLPPFQSKVKSGYLKRYSELVTSASTGAVFKD